MSIATQISRLTSIRNSIKAKLVSLGLLQESGGGPTPSTKSGTSQSGNVVVGDDLEACKQAINSINETTPYLLSSTGAKNVAGYKYAQVDTTVFEPIGSSGSINPNVQNAYIGASGGISTSAPSGSVPVSLGQISPSGNYQGMSAINLLYDSSVIKAENIRSGVSILGVTGNYLSNFESYYVNINDEFGGQSGYIYQITFNIPISFANKTCMCYSIFVNQSLKEIPEGTCVVSSVTYFHNVRQDNAYLTFTYPMSSTYLGCGYKNIQIHTTYASGDSLKFQVGTNEGGGSNLYFRDDVKYGLYVVFY